MILDFLFGLCPCCNACSPSAQVFSVLLSSSVVFSPRKSSLSAPLNVTLSVFFFFCLLIALWVYASMETSVTSVHCLSPSVDYKIPPGQSQYLMFAFPMPIIRMTLLCRLKAIAFLWSLPRKVSTFTNRVYLFSPPCRSRGGIKISLHFYCLPSSSLTHQTLNHIKRTKEL